MFEKMKKRRELKKLSHEVFSFLADPINLMLVLEPTKTFDSVYFIFGGFTVAYQVSRNPFLHPFEITTDKGFYADWYEAVPKLYTEIQRLK